MEPKYCPVSDKWCYCTPRCDDDEEGEEHEEIVEDDSHAKGNAINGSR